MSRFVLQVLDGPLKGQFFPVGQGLLIGRNKGDIRLKDPSVSSIHAEIQTDSQGRVKIIDRDSKNKILFKGEKREELSLLEGMKFQIGKTELCLAPAPDHGKIISRVIEKEAEQAELKDRPLSLKPFAKGLELEWLAGTQKGHSFCLFYGPRVFGSASPDLPIFEKEAPDKAFAFVPSKKDIFFITDFPDLVFLNGKEIARSPLKDGDKISVGRAVLEIRFERQAAKKEGF